MNSRIAALSGLILMTAISQNTAATPARSPQQPLAATPLPSGINIYSIQISTPTSTKKQPYLLYANGNQQAPIYITLTANKKIDPATLMNALYLYDDDTGEKLAWKAGSGTQYTDIRNKYDFGIAGNHVFNQLVHQPLLHAPNIGNDPGTNIQTFYFSTDRIGMRHLCAAVQLSPDQVKTTCDEGFDQNITVNVIRQIDYTANDLNWGYDRYYSYTDPDLSPPGASNSKYTVTTKNKLRLYCFALIKTGLKLPFIDPGNGKGSLETLPIKFDSKQRSVSFSYPASGTPSTTASQPYTGYILTGGISGFTTSFLLLFHLADQYGNQDYISTALEIG